ncbi:predicted protein [Uncinocarpus reesii 1704]|uniref:Uncharacterized protein n=1 Tax=Uncinocarpus reesii (strain UAMH 1704) TaxID=336963 RepID=C4JFL6_UNCRE|nr:uncharacterized protein UREG_01030 [Uncinocarpus reesii 1704]EEP76181.1 predicted protein [Uncinocarpus reesii 1704]
MASLTATKKLPRREEQERWCYDRLDSAPDLALSNQVEAALPCLPRAPKGRQSFHPHFLEQKQRSGSHARSHALSQLGLRARVNLRSRRAYPLVD